MNAGKEMIADRRRAGGREKMPNTRMKIGVRAIDGQRKIVDPARKVEPGSG